MELKYPWVIFVGVPLLILLIVFRIKKEKKYKTGTKIANTQYSAKIPYYQKKLAQYKLLKMAIKTICIITIIISLVLISQPIKIHTEEIEIHGRDIFIVIDASTSVNSVTEKICNNFKSMVDELNGERVGITIFNTTSVLLVPLTDDYDYVKFTLDEIIKALDAQEKQAKRQDYDFYYYEYMFAGTIQNSARLGSSLIGDGLAAGVYQFPKIDEDRSRTIIFATDNVNGAQKGAEIMNLRAACELTKEKNIHLYAIAPSENEVEPDEFVTAQDFAEGRAELKKEVEAVGGTYFESTSEANMKKIIKKINETTKSLIKNETKKREIGQPTIPFILLFGSIVVLLVINKKVKL